MTVPLSWIPVPGGVCHYGDRATPRPVSDLIWTATPVAYGHLDPADPRGDDPVTGVTWAEAAAIAARLDGRLPTSTEWEWMAAGRDRRPYPWGAQPWRPALARLAPAGHRCPGSVGAHPGGATPEGLLDVAGCVWEWTATATVGEGRIIRGGSYASAPMYARTTFLNAAPAELRSPGIGLRVVRPA